MSLKPTLENVKDYLLETHVHSCYDDGPWEVVFTG